MPPRRSRQIRLSVTDKEYQAITDMTTPIRRTELLMREIERIQDDNIGYGDRVSLQMSIEAVCDVVGKWTENNFGYVFNDTSDLQFWAEYMLDTETKTQNGTSVTIDGNIATIVTTRAGIDYIISRLGGQK